MEGHGVHSKPLPKLHLTWGDRDDAQDPTNYLSHIIDATNPICLDKLSTYASLVDLFKKWHKDMMGLQLTLKELETRFNEHLEKQTRLTKAQIGERMKLSIAVKKLKQACKSLERMANVVIGKFAVHIAIVKKHMNKQEAYLTSAETDVIKNLQVPSSSLEEYLFDDLEKYIGCEEYNRVVKKYYEQIKYLLELLR